MKMAMEKLARQGRVHQEAKFIGTSGGLYWKKTVDTPKVPTKKMVNKNPYL